MRRIFLRVILTVALLAGVQRVSAFSMLGPFEAWQVNDLGYQISSDIGGPMNLGEEYRWNTPTLIYAYDESFLNYFGAVGVREVEKAIQMLNDLPPVSQMSATLAEYPRDTRRFNYRAQSLFLWDLKSWALAGLMEQVGLASPERWAWTLRGHDEPVPGFHRFSVIQRNFDPVTLRPSPYVNGVLYTYVIFQTYVQPVIWEAVDYAVDPFDIPVNSVAGFISTGGGTVDPVGDIIRFTFGLYLTGLTRDDVGGIRYLIRPENINVETLATNATLAGSGFPWGPPVGGTGTNATGTNVLAAVNQALRPGIDKLNFVRADYDSTVGFWVPLTNNYTDTYVTNRYVRQQVVQRVLLQPDILFSAADLDLGTFAPVVYRRVDTTGWVNNDGINGNEALAGPGTITPTVITFSKVGPTRINTSGTGFSELDSVPWFAWGAYDGTTNEPVAFPVGTSIRELEQRVLSGAGGLGNVWGP